MVNGVSNTSIDWRTLGTEGYTSLWLFSLRGFLVGLLLLIVIVISHVIIIPLVQQLCQHLLDIFQSCLLISESLFLSLHTPTEVNIIVIVSHVDWNNPCLSGVDGGRESVTTSFCFIIWPWEEASQWFWQCCPYGRGGLSIIIGYCYPGVGASEGTFWFNQNLS